MLSTRAEQARPEDARGLLEELAASVWPSVVAPVAGFDTAAWLHRWATFRALLDIGTDEAFLAAAMMLVPERCWLRMDDWPRDLTNGAVATVCPLVEESDNEAFTGTGANLALAMIAAIARSVE